MYLATCPDDISTFKDIIEKIHIGTIIEEHPSMRARLLEKLYPQHFSLDQLFRYLIEDSPNFIGHYTIFSRQDLPDLIPEADLIEALDRLTNILEKSSEHKRDIFGEIHAKLLLRVLKVKSHTVQPSSFYEWTKPYNERMYNPYMRKEAELSSANSECRPVVRQKLSFF